MRSIYNEYGTNIQDLIELGEMLKYKFGGPGAQIPTPEALKNYMDVSRVAISLSFIGFIGFCLLAMRRINVISQ